MNLEGWLIGERYKILHFIGEGGMSRVYKAEDTAGGGFAAVKFMKENVTSRYLEDLIRFKKEIEIAGKLRHPGIARIFGSGEQGGLPYIVMELLEGQSFESYLDGRIPANGEYTPDYREIAVTFLKLAEILEYVHSNGIVHRDVKPGNFFVGGEGSGLRFKLLDFGVSHIMELTGIQGRQGISGTFGYMSPEATGRLSGCVDERSDLYSLGVIFYRLLTGVLPFRESDVGRLLHQQVAVNPAPPESIDPSVPAILSGIVMKLMEKDPDSRYQSANGLILDINRVIQGETEFIPGSMDCRQRLTYRTKLVGREKEMERIIDLLNEAGHGKGGICLIGGEAGSGKSRLLDEFRDYAGKRNIMLIGGRCLNHINKSPYQPFIDALDEYLLKLENSEDPAVKTETERVREHHEEWGEILVRLNPRMRRIFGETKTLAPLEPERETQRFLTVMSGFFCNLAAADNGFVLALDDLQWADEGSIRLLCEISARIGESNLMIIGSYRDNEAQIGTRLAGPDGKAAKLNNPVRGNSPVKRSNPAKRVFEIKLGQLDRGAVKEMISCIFGGAGDSMPELSEYLYGKSEGNPLFALNILRELVEKSAVSRRDGKWSAEAENLNRISIPGGVVDIILERIGRLMEPERELLGKAAVMGREFDIELLCGLVRRNLDEGVEMTDRAVSLQFLETSSNKGRLLFAHDRIRDAFFNMMDQEERQSTHKAILEALEAIKNDQLSGFAFQLAHHAIEAGEEEKILKYAVPAADKARTAYANEEAIRFYQIVQLLLEKRLPGCLEQWIRISENLIELYLLTGRNDEAIFLSERLLPEITAQNGLAGIYKKIGTAYHQKADWDRCGENIIKAMKLLGETFPESRRELAFSFLKQSAVYLGNRLSRKKPGVPALKDPEGKKQVIWMYETLNWMYVFNDVYTCFYIIIAALNLAERIGISKELGTCLSNYAAAHMILSMFERALKHQKKALRIRTEIGDEWGVAKSLQMLGSNYLWKGDYKNGIKLLNKSEAAFRKIGDAWESGIVSAELMRLYIYTGDYGKSMHYCDLHYEECLHTGNAYGINAANLGRVNCHIEMGDFSEAESILDEILASTKENNLIFLHCYALAYMGSLHIEKGLFEDAVNYLVLAKQIYIKNHFLKDFILFIFPHLAEAAVKRADRILREKNVKPSAAEIAKMRKLCAEALKRTKPWPNHYGASLRSAAEFYALAGNRAKAGRLFLKSIAYEEKLERKYETAKGYHGYGVFLFDNGSAAAPEYMHRAFSLYREIGAKENAKKCERVLREHGMAGSDDASTARERLRSDRRMTSVLTAGRLISSILDPDILLEKILDEIMLLVGADNGMLLLYPEAEGKPEDEADERKLQVKAARNMSGEEGGRKRFTEASSSIIRQVETEKTPLLASDAQLEGPFRNMNSVLLHDIKSVICAPVMAKGKLMGVIYLGNNHLNGLFDDYDLDVVDMLAGQAGVSLQNARMYVKLKQYAEEIGKSRDEIAEWNRKLECRVEERTQELNEKNRELASMLKKLQEHADMVEELAVAKERNRFAMDAHDNLGHTITLLIKLLEVSRLTCLDHPERMAANLADASNIAREGLEQLRSSIRGLASMKTKEYNLLNALKGLAGNFEALGIHVELTVQGIGSLKEPEQINTLYNLCMEAMTNAVRHGKAKNISVIIKKEDGFLRTILFDDGCGCDAIVQGFGLTGMEKRIRAVDGSISFSSSPGEGFLIHAEIPLSEEQSV